jgi:hypothetical protein
MTHNATSSKPIVPSPMTRRLYLRSFTAPSRFAVEGCATDSSHALIYIN